MSSTVTKKDLTDRLVDTLGLHPARVDRQGEQGVGGVILRHHLQYAGGQAAIPRRVR